MRRLRLSIASLLMGIAVLGVTFTALIHPSPLWGNAFYSLTLATLTIAVLAAIYSRGRDRAFWVGFSTCGWLYFLVAINGPDQLSRFGRNLVTTAILDILYPYTIPKAAGGAAMSPADPSASPARLARTSRGGGMVILTGAFGGTPAPPIPPPSPWEIWTSPDRQTVFNQRSPNAFMKIGHSMFCLIFATIGGLLTRRFQEARDGARST